MTTTLLGQLVGANVAKSGFAGVLNRFKDGSDDILIRDYANVLNTNLIGDIIVLGTFKSTAFIDPAAMLWFDAFGAGVTLNIGDVNHANGLAAALDVSGAGSANLIKTFTASKMGDPLWKRLGYASDPGGLLTIQAVIAGANVGNNASIAWKIVGKNT